MAAQEIRVPDIGDFHEVPVIEIHVAAGDTVAVEDPLVTLESDKATMDVPSPVAGTVTGLAVALGDNVSAGTLIVTVEDRRRPSAEERSPPAAGTAGSAAAHRSPRSYRARGLRHSAAPPTPPTAASNGAVTPYTGTKGDVHAEVLVLGAGPGGYTAAFRAADLGKRVVLVDSRGPLGGCASTSAASRPRPCCTRPR